MLPRRLRLGRAEFAEAATGRRAQSAHFSVTVRKNTEKGGSAAVISKKVAKKSVDRHLLKRRILEVLRPYTNSSRSIVVFARAGSPSLPFKALKEELTALLKGAV